MTTVSPSPLQQEKTSAPGRFDRKALFSKLGPAVGLVLVYLLFGSLRPKTFLTLENVEMQLIQTAVVGAGALGMTLIIVSGGIDLSVGSAIALCTVVIARLIPHETFTAGASQVSWGFPVALAFIPALAGVLAGAACGGLTGLMVTRLRLTPFIVTLGLWGALRGAALGLADLRPIYPKDPTYLNDLLNSLREGQRWMLFPPGVWLTLALAVVVALMIRYTRFGRHIFAIGSNEQTARLCGVNVDRTKVMIYVVAGALVGVAGVLQYSFLTGGDPGTAPGYELKIIAAVVIGGASLNGGQGSILGSLLGAMMMTAVGDGCTKVGLGNWIQQIVTGAIIVLAATVDQWRQRRAV
jgi:ribose transport system permease protein